MLLGKFWITPQGVIDVTTSEHALYAKNFLLGLEGADCFRLPEMLRPLSHDQAERFLKRGVDRTVLRFLSRPGNDPRVYAIQHLGWIRVRREQFWVWKLDALTLQCIQGANGFWRAQRDTEPDDCIEIFQYPFGRSNTKFLTIRELLASDLTQRGGTIQVDDRERRIAE